MQMGISIKQIAIMANVSRGTVDRALNDREGINPLIKDRILAIAAEAGYRSNRAGKILGNRKKPFRIGIQMPSVGNDFFLDVQEGLEQAAAELADFGLSLSIRTMKGFSVKTQIDQIRSLLQEGIHGLAFVPINHPDIVALLQELAARRLPVITFNTDIQAGEHLGYVGNDYLHSGAIAAGLLGLIADGRPLRTLIVTGSPDILGHNQRIDGFKAIIKEHYPRISILDTLANQDDDQLSYELVRSALQQQPGIEAIYMTAGGVAGACRAMEDHGSGHRIKLVCFDQVRSALPYQRAGLITAAIGQEPFRQGYLSVKLLFDYLLDGTRPPVRTLTRNEIFIREHIMVSEATEALK
jgi:LacI family transcriptional regulator